MVLMNGGYSKAVFRCSHIQILKRDESILKMRVIGPEEREPNPTDYESY